MPNYSIQTLDGEEFAMARYDKVSGTGQRYIITFVSDGQRGGMRYDISFGKKLAKELVESHVVKNAKFNPDGEKRFLLANPMPGANTTTNNTTNTSNETTIVHDGVERDHSQPIYIQGLNITQAGITIGTYKTKTSATDGKINNILSFYLPDGTKVAEATVNQMGGNCKITTLKDNKLRTINITVTADFDQAKEVAKYLSEHYYL